MAGIDQARGEEKEGKGNFNNENFFWGGSKSCVKHSVTVSSLKCKNTPSVFREGVLFVAFSNTN